MNKIIFTSLFLICSCAILAQTYNMKIKQGLGTTYSATSTVDEITFLNTTTTPFVCGDVILHGGETYQTVLIGSQCWFQKNLNIGTRINGSTDQTNNSTIEKYCYNDLAANCVTYGGLYQWAEAVQGICPTGWHIPTYAELQTLGTAVSNDGNALKAVGQGTGSGIGTNTSGFSALLAGYRGDNSSFDGLGGNAGFWSSTEYDTGVAYGMVLGYDGNGISISNGGSKAYGFSVRCLKD